MSMHTVASPTIHQSSYVVGLSTLIRRLYTLILFEHLFITYNSDWSQIMYLHRLSLHNCYTKETLINKLLIYTGLIKVFIHVKIVLSKWVAI